MRVLTRLPSGCQRVNRGAGLPFANWYDMQSRSSPARDAHGSRKSLSFRGFDPASVPQAEAAKPLSQTRFDASLSSFPFVLGSGDDIVNNLTGGVGQAEITSAVAIRELRMID